MKAAIVEDCYELPRYGDFPDPVPRPGDVRVEVVAAAIHPLVKAIAGPGGLVPGRVKKASTKRR